MHIALAYKNCIRIKTDKWREESELREIEWENHKQVYTDKQQQQQQHRLYIHTELIRNGLREDKHMHIVNEANVKETQKNEYVRMYILCVRMRECVCETKEQIKPVERQNNTTANKQTPNGNSFR